jgi:adenosylhomocysteine nucleosidase
MKRWCGSRGLTTAWLGLALLTGALFPGAAGARRLTGILGAFDAEVATVRQALGAPRDTTCLGLTFTLGELRGRPVVLTMAGVGKVNAAMTATLLIEHFRPEEVLFTGIAGGLSPDLDPGDIVLGAKVVHHDFAVAGHEGTSVMATRAPSSTTPNPIYFPADSALLALATEVGRDLALAPIPARAGPRAPRVVAGVIATGESFVASTARKQELRDRLGADAVEMEGAAVAQICHQLGTPCLVVRSLSDRADSSAVRDVEQFYRIAADNSAALVMGMAARLALRHRSREPLR